MLTIFLLRMSLNVIRFDMSFSFISYLSGFKTMTDERNVKRPIRLQYVHKLKHQL